MLPGYYSPPGGPRPAVRFVEPECRHGHRYRPRPPTAAEVGLELTECVGGFTQAPAPLPAQALFQGAV